MSSSTAFLLSPCDTTSLPPSASLCLLPFSLGSSSSPYVSSSAPLSSYFQPRSSPSNSIAPTGSIIASFRGRQVVGQTICVPRGYVGLVLSTSKRPDRGGIETHASLSETRGTYSGAKNPLTPASSVPSELAHENHEGAGEAGFAMRRSSPRKPPVVGGRVRGAGQVALARPKTRQASRNTAQVSRKRFRIDSDDEDEEGEGGRGDSPSSTGSPATTTASNVVRTPSKRAKTQLGFTTPQKPSGGEGISPIPEIVIQEATPLKNPLPTPKKRLSSRSRRGSPSPISHVGSIAAEKATMPMIGAMHGEDTVDNHILDGDAQETVSRSASSSLIEAIEEEENVIPSPATEDDPPSFDVGPPTIDKIKSEPKHESDATHVGGEEQKIESVTKYHVDVEGPVRLLKPVSRFEGFMLYTPDVPLAGFRADEGVSSITESESEQGVDADGSKEHPEEKEREDSNSHANANANTITDGRPSGSSSGIEVRKGWWRSGGAGEGGDEMVRAMGEWLGLVEILNKPVYLDDLEDDSDDNEE